MKLDIICNWRAVPAPQISRWVVDRVIFMITKGTWLWPWPPDFAIQLTMRSLKLQKILSHVNQWALGGVCSSFRSKVPEKSQLWFPLKWPILLLHPNNWSSGFSSHLLKRLPRVFTFDLDMKYFFWWFFSTTCLSLRSWPISQHLDCSLLSIEATDADSVLIYLSNKCVGVILLLFYFSLYHWLFYHNY